MFGRYLCKRSTFDHAISSYSGLKTYVKDRGDS